MQSVFGFDYDNIGGGYVPQTEFVAGDGSVLTLDSTVNLPPVAIPQYSIGSYTPSYQIAPTSTGQGSFAIPKMSGAIGSNGLLIGVGVLALMGAAYFGMKSSK